MFIELLDENSVTWKELVLLLCDDTGTKDKRILYPQMATLFPIPIDELEYQRLNNHMDMFTQTRTGKSKTYENVTGMPNPTDTSIITALGTYRDGVLSEGTLNGNGIWIHDESTSKTDWKIHDSTLNYTRSGQQSRGIWGLNVQIQGTKTMIILGNSSAVEPNVDDFHKIICKFASEYNLDRISERLGHIVYGNFDKINPTVESKGVLQLQTKIRIIMREMFKYYSSKIFNKTIYIGTVQHFINSYDINFKNEVYNIAKSCSYDTIIPFILGRASIEANQRRRFGVIKLLMLFYADKIYKMKNPEVETFMKEIISTEGKEIIKMFTDSELYSLKFMTESTKDKYTEFISYINSHNLLDIDKLALTSTRLEVCEKIGISETTFYRYRAKIFPNINFIEDL